MTGAGRGEDAVFRSPTVVGVDMGVPHFWGLRLTSGDAAPDQDDVAAAVAWCRRHDTGSGWAVSAPEHLVGHWPGLEVDERIGLFATDAATASALPLRAPGGVDLDHDPGLDDVRAAYGAWMDDDALAHRLVGPHDVEHPDRAFVVAHVGGEPVGCAFVWWAAGTAYLSGIGVRADLRGRGIGNALTTSAALAGAARPGTDVVWMLATPEGAHLYGRMGFALVDTEVQLRGS